MRVKGLRHMVIMCWVVCESNSILLSLNTVSYNAKPRFSLSLSNGLKTCLGLVARIGVKGKTWKSLLEAGTPFWIGVTALLQELVSPLGLVVDFPADLAVGLGEHSFFWSCCLVSQL